MPVKVISVTERAQIGQNGQVSQALVVKYLVGSQGPFTLVTTAADLGSGAAMQKMQQFAATISTLPIDSFS